MGSIACWKEFSGDKSRGESILATNGSGIRASVASVRQRMESASVAKSASLQLFPPASETRLMPVE